MSTVVLDAGALVDVDRDRLDAIALLTAASAAGMLLRTNANVVAQVWRNDRGRQVNLGRLLRSVDVQPIDELLGRKVGELLARAGTSDVVDASLVLLANNGDQILTGDHNDIANLLSATTTVATIISC